MLELMVLLNIPVKDVKTLRGSPTVKYIGYWWDPHHDRITLDDDRWNVIEGRLEDFRVALVSFSSDAQMLRCLTGLLVWASVVIPTAKVFNRGFHTVLQRLKATSLPASEARLIVISDESMVADVLVDLMWWADLCRSFRLGAVDTYGY